MKKKYKVAIIENFPVYYRTPFIEKLSKSKDVYLKAFFGSDNSSENVYRSEECDFKKGIKVERETKIGDFDYEFLRDYNPKKKFFIRNIIDSIRLIRRLKKDQYDAAIMHSYSPFMHKMVIIGLKLNGIPLIFKDVWDRIDNKSKIKRVVKSMFLKIVLDDFVDAVLYTYSRSKKLYKKFGVADEKLFFSPCAVNNKLLRREAKKLLKERPSIKEEIGIIKNSKVVLFVGKITPRKRVFDILRAYEKVSYEKEKSLLFVGSGIKEREMMEKYIEKEGVKNVFFTGFKRQKDISKYYSIADIFIVVSKYDPSPKVLFEAMNFSLPVIVGTDVGTADDLVREGVNGFKIKTGDLNSLSKYIQNLLENNKLRENMGKKSLEIVQSWNYDNAVRGATKALNYVLRKKNGK